MKLPRSLAERKIVFVSFFLVLILFFKNNFVFLSNYLSYVSQELPIRPVFYLLLPTLAALLALTVLLRALKAGYKGHLGVKVLKPLDERSVLLEFVSGSRLLGGIELSPNEVMEGGETKTLEEGSHTGQFSNIYALVAEEGFNLSHVVIMERCGDKPQNARIKCFQFMFLYKRPGSREEIDSDRKLLSQALSKAEASIEVVNPEMRAEILEGERLLSAIELVFGSNPSNNLTPSQGSVHPGLSAIWPIANGTPRSETERYLDIGMSLLSGKPVQSFSLPLEVFPKHVSIFGSTGSGKTTTAKTILKALFEHGIPFLVLDVHNEYMDLVSSLGGTVVSFDGNVHLDVLQPYSFESANEHIDTVTDVFSQIYNFSPPQVYMFREAFTQAFLEKRLADKDMTIEGLVEKIESFPIRSFYDNETKYALLRRLKPLASSEGRVIFSAGIPLKVDALTSKPSCILLGNIRSSDLRRLAAAMVLTLVYEYRLVAGQSELRHVTLIEEAQNILPFRNRSVPPSVIEKLFFEMRKYGEGLILIAQFPSQVFSDVVKSTGTRIVHRITEMAEAPYVSDILGIEPKRCGRLKYLPVGKAYVFTEGLSEAILVEITPSNSH